MIGRLTLGGLLVALALPALAAPPIETMSAPEVDQAACDLVAMRERFHAKVAAVKAEPRLTRAESEYLLTTYTDLLQRLADTASYVRARQHAFPKYDFHCRP